MTKEEQKGCCCDNKKGWKQTGATGGSGAVYGFGLFGALFYFLSNANTFGGVVMGILKALVWPALLVYHLLGFLKI